MPSWSTNALRPHERFDHWVDVRIAKHGRGSATLERDMRRDFDASYSVCRVADATVCEMRTSAYRFDRLAADISRMELDRFDIVHQVGSGCRLQGPDASFLVPAGGYSTHHTDTPYSLLPVTEHAGFHARVVAVPFQRCLPFIRPDKALSIQPLSVDSAMGALFASYFDSFIAQAPHLSGAAADIALQTLVQLALVTRGLASPQDESGRDAIRAGQREAVRRFIERNLPRADLAPAGVARALGISVRQLHLLFEPTGTTFSRYLLTRRLERARQSLALHPQRSILDVALDCGIESTTVFYRGFRNAFGMAPGDYRRWLRDSG
jgi:AraC-like DNA-binding protein